MGPRSRDSTSATCLRSHSTVRVHGTFLNCRPHGFRRACEICVWQVHASRTTTWMPSGSPSSISTVEGKSCWYIRKLREGENGGKLRKALGKMISQGAQNHLDVVCDPGYVIRKPKAPHCEKPTGTLLLSRWIPVPYNSRLPLPERMHDQTTTALMALQKLVPLSLQPPLSVGRSS